MLAGMIACLFFNRALALEPLNDEQLANTLAGDGISFSFENFRISGTHTITLTDDPSSATPGTVVLQNMSIHGAAGPDDPVNLGSFDDSFRLDVLRGNKLDTNELLVFIRLDFPDSPAGFEPLYIDFDDISVNGKSLGALSYSGIQFNDTHLDLRGKGGGGLVWGYQHLTTIDEILFSTNALTQSEFSIKGIHIAGDAIGAPEDPATWSFTLPYKLSDVLNQPFILEAGNTVDAGTGANFPFMQIELLPHPNPASTPVGFIRIEEIRLGNTSFGPTAIDGLRINHMSIRAGG